MVVSCCIAHHCAAAAACSNQPRPLQSIVLLARPENQRRKIRPLRTVVVPTTTVNSSTTTLRISTEITQKRENIQRRRRLLFFSKQSRPSLVRCILFHCRHRAILGDVDENNSAFPPRNDHPTTYLDRITHCCRLVGPQIEPYTLRQAGLANKLAKHLY